MSIFNILVPISAVTIAVIFLIILIAVYIKFKRNRFNKHNYVRLVKYNDDMSITIRYIKKTQFNKDKSLLINPKHVYNFNGYTSIIYTSTAQESINPINFESKYDVDHFKSAIRTKLIRETFESLKVEKFDKIMALLFLNIIQLIAISYLLYTILGGNNG